MIKTLLLDGNWRPLKVITWEKAMTMLCLSKASVVMEYEDKTIRSATKEFPIPSILRANSVSKASKNRVNCTSTNIFIRDKFNCAYCSKKIRKSELTVDHVNPVTKGGKWEWINLVTACRTCNQKKGGQTPEEARMKLIYQPVEPKWSISYSVRLTKEDPIVVWSDYLMGLDVVFGD